ncbi:MAG: S24 family peptidase [Anaerolineae bacterium]|nr:S24 family peptidase [Anaerolineae bacterium]
MTRNAGEAPADTAGHKKVSEGEAVHAVVDALKTSMRQGRMPFLEVSSNSMAPLLRRGQRIGLAPAQAHQLRSGDVVTFLEDGHLTTHRFWGRDDPYLKSRGDRSGQFDRPWRREALIGRVVMYQAAGRSMWLDHGTGRYLNRLLFCAGKCEERLLAWCLPARPVRVAIRLLATMMTAAAYRSREVL